VLKSREGAERYRAGRTKLLSFIVLILTWWIVSLLVPSTIIPGPWATAKCIGKILASGDFFFHFYKTMVRVLVGLACSMLLGIIVGTLMGLYQSVEKALDLWIMVGLTIPGLVYTIFALMWFGLTEFAAIFAISITTFPSITINVWGGVKDIDTKLIEMSKIFGASKKKRFFSVVLPQIIPYLFASLRFGLGIIWKVTVIVEMLGLSSGVGYMLNYWFNLYNMPQVFGWSAIFIIFMLFFELILIKRLERRFLVWRPRIRF